MHGLLPKGWMIGNPAATMLCQVSFFNIMRQGLFSSHISVNVTSGSNPTLL
jgi:hypothetical protein